MILTNVLVDVGGPSVHMYIKHVSYRFQSKKRTVKYKRQLTPVQITNGVMCMRQLVSYPIIIINEFSSRIYASVVFNRVRIRLVSKRTTIVRLFNLNSMLSIHLFRLMTAHL